VQGSDYKTRKAYFDRLLTLFGRNPVMEALQSSHVTPVRLHLADSNKPSPQLTDMQTIARGKGADIVFHTRQELARISRNGRQDQGVALDIETPGYQSLDALLAQAAREAGAMEFIALDQVINPQNLGMIIRSVAASPIAGLIVPRQGGARMDGLVIKASAGTLFQANIYTCDQLEPSLSQLATAGFRILGLGAGGQQSIDQVPSGRNVFVLGNESTGLSSNIRSCCSGIVSIPLQNQVESLNVSVAASIVAFRSIFARHT